jgi:hypothetical protein
MIEMILFLILAGFFIYLGATLNSIFIAVAAAPVLYAGKIIKIGFYKLCPNFYSVESRRLWKILRNGARGWKN